MIRKFIKKICIIISIIILSYGIFLLVIPISRSNESVRKYLLRQLPLGISWNETIHIIEKDKKFKLLYISENYGVIKQKNINNFWIGDTLDEYTEKIGDKSMIIYLGEYYFPTSHIVTAYLAFDKNDELIEIGIKKEIDGP